MAETFQLVATTEGRDRAVTARLADAIGETFGVDLSGLLDALEETGVCVAETTSLAEARTLGAQILAAGADYRILDVHGEELDAATAAPPQVETRKPRTRSKTRMGGFGMPEVLGMGAPRSTPPQKANAGPDEIQLEESGGFAHANSTVGEGAIDIGNKPSAPLELEESGGFAHANSTVGEGAVDISASPSKDRIELDDRSGFAAPGAPATQGAMALDSDPNGGKLELEDGGFAHASSTIAEGAVDIGSAADQPAGEIELDGPGGFSSPSSTISEGAVDIGASDEKLELSGPGGFAAPASMKDGFSLDQLDVDALVMLDGSTTSPAKPSTRSAPSPSSTARRTVDEASFLPPDATNLETESELELEEPMPSPKPAEDTAGPGDDDPSAVGRLDGELEWVPAPKDAPTTEAKSPQPTPEPPDDPQHPHHATSSARTETAHKLPSGPLFLGGKLRRWPLARVAVGFILALGLSSILPLMHAHSVRSDRIQPLLVDLATARDHGALLASSPGYQPPTQLETTIDGIRHRHAFYSVMVWSILGALLLFLWFRFT